MTTKEFEVVTLKPIEELLIEWKLNGYTIKKYDSIGFEVISPLKRWVINSDMVKRFGKQIIVIPHKQPLNYSHVADHGYYYHESWFQEFLEDNLFEI